ncbi:Major facilitator superfamily domain containing protein [Naviculisporaceae sp. PSN 640]
MSDFLPRDEQSPQATSTTPLLPRQNNGSHCGYYGVSTASTSQCENISPVLLEDGDSNEDDKTQEAYGETTLPTWSKWGLAVAYMSILLMAFTTSLEGQVTYVLTAFATSSFKNHSLLSTVYVVQSVVNAVIKPPMAKIANVFGRLEAFGISVTLCVLGYILMASSQNIETYASAQIFYSAGSTGLQILQQVFIADTSTFLNRALFSSLPESPFLVTVWIGPPIADTILHKFNTWRWGYGIWAVILPVAFLPLGISLFLSNRRTQKRNRQLVKKSPLQSHETAQTGPSLLQDLDIIGTLLLSSGLSLILLPLTLVSHSSSGWSDPRIQIMIILGIILLVLFPIFESQPHLAPRPLLPPFLLKSRTFVLGCCIGFFYFMIFYIAVQPYFYSYLLVALNLPVARAGQVTQTFSFASTIAAILVSLGIRQMKVSKGQLRRFVAMGAGLYTTAIGILVYTRRRDATLGSLFLAQGVLGSGAGLMHVVTQLMVQASASSNNLGALGEKEYVGVATAAFLTVVEVGGAVGAALSGAVWGKILPGKLEMYLPEEIKGQAKEIFSSVEVASGFAWGSVEREAIGRAYQETITVLLWVALALCIPLLGVAGLLPGQASGSESGSGREDYVTLLEGEGEGGEVEGDGKVKIKGGAQVREIVVGEMEETRAR